MRKPILVIFALLAVVLLASGCGQTSSVSSSESFKGEEKQVADAVKSLQEASKNLKGKKLCTELFAKSLVTQIETGGAKCASKMEKSLKDADDFAVFIKTIDVKGNTARAQVSQNKDKKNSPESTFTFEKQADKWRLSSVSG